MYRETKYMNHLTTSLQTCESVKAHSTLILRVEKRNITLQSRRRLEPRYIMSRMNRTRLGYPIGWDPMIPILLMHRWTAGVAGLT